MTQSDKDFITRIQVSQLVTQVPYAEDFYAQVFSTINQSRMGPGPGPGRAGHQKVLSFGDGVGVGVVPTQERRSGRRENALNRMQTQIERIVSNGVRRSRLINLLSEQLEVVCVISRHGMHFIGRGKTIPRITQ